MTDIQQAELRKTVRRKIDAYGIYIQLYRKAAPVSDGAGGRTRTLEDVMLTPLKRYLKSVVREYPKSENQEGFDSPTDFVLIGLWNDDIRKGDYFFVNEQRYDVFYVHFDTSYQVKALVTVHGQKKA